MPADNEGHPPGSHTSAGGLSKSPYSLPENASVPPQDLVSDPLLRPLPRVTIGNLTAPVLGRIPLLARLGKGAMGAVYYGVHPRLKNEVAIKVLQSFLAEKDPALIERFFREAQTAAKVSSQHLVRVSDVDEEYGLFYIVMEYVRGMSVAEYIKKGVAAGRTGVDEQDALRIVIAATKGLAAAHTEGIIHRDVKPANIMLPRRKDGNECDLDYAKLADLGLARPEGQLSGLTVLFEALGTPGYMAPEQAQDASSVGKPADVFSMGATLYALLRGKPPFTGKNAVAILTATIQDPPPPISEVRPDVSLATAAVMDRCLAKDPARRYPDGEALVEALRSCRDELAAAADAQAIAPASGDGPATIARRSTRPRTTTTRLRRTPTPTARPPKPRVSEPPQAAAPAAAEPVASGERYPPLGTSDLGKPAYHVGWPFDAYEAEQRQKAVAAATGLPERLTVPLGGDVGLEMALLPAGEFLMGSPHGEEFREKDEASHYVRLPRPFYIGLSPVTQAQWKALTGGNASRFKDLPDSPQRPVERVSWNDIQEKFLSKLRPLANTGWEFRLPTEAEWEYGCRAGTETPFNFGLAVSVEKLNCKEDRTSGSNWKWVYRHDLMGVPKERLETTAVGTYPPNAWGLLDVHGNVWEWCEDWYDAGFYHGTAAVEPRNITPGDGHVLRGGSWNYSARYCRAACRYRSAEDSRNFNFGFRIVCAMTGRVHQTDRTE